jgi:flagellar hook-associated protein 1 FlgK
MDMIRNDINGEINTAVNSINAYATELAALNDTIAKSQSTTGSPPNDLLDQRDQIVTELSKLTKVTVIPQDNKYNVFIGNGQPIVLGGSVNQLQVSVSPTDPTRTQIAYTSNGKLTQIPENGLPGGKLGGLFDFRANTLDPAQSSIGRIAIGVASAFNDQHTLGLDLNGQAGTQFFKIDPPVVKPSSGIPVRLC